MHRRLSIDPKSPFFHPLAHRCVPTVDGQPVPRVRESDETQGWVIVLSRYSAAGGTVREQQLADGTWIADSDDRWMSFHDPRDPRPTRMRTETVPCAVQMTFPQSTPEEIAEIEAFFASFPDPEGVIA